MICKGSLYKVCYERFADYPLAVKAVDRSGSMRSMVLMLQGPNDAGFFILSHDFGKDRPLFWLWSWPAGSVVEIEDGSDDIPDAAMNAVLRGVPIPRHGSLLGWTCEGVISALIAVYAEYAPERPEPGWAIMPLAGTSQAQWPPFTGERLFGHWSWKHYRARDIVSLDGLVAETPDTVFWVDTKAILGSDCCAVAHDVISPERYVLRRGSYVYYQALQAGPPAPSLVTLLADPGKIDLANRFQRSHGAI